MQAVVFKGPLQVALEERPIPELQAPTDAIVKVRYTALCGSELHVYRGHQPSATGFIMGHEFTGTIQSIGSAIKNFQPGDMVVSPFTTTCGDCFYCRRGHTSRCTKCLLYGSAVLDGAQAEYVRVPLADTTLEHAPELIDEKKLVLMADIFPTGYFAGVSGFAGLTTREVTDATVLVFGCGPVGICAVVSALEMHPGRVIAVDSVGERLECARKLGAEVWNFQTQGEELRERVKEVTDGRGADVAVEVVGHSSALRMAFEMIRPWGKIFSVGVHNGEIPWTGNEAYAKNLSIQMGRCPVKSVFQDALNMLVDKQDVMDFMVKDVRPLSQAVQAYDDFNHMRSQKIIFEAGK
ncbi:zinc-containing alcohol dehydrogenase [Aspergillus heteromorphus CBS 117.55]|uniref:Zinc-containing alcohol dehydrogenase n=1 Tax=Aspergillus heteromorphus CBS 117.55 TaxID=1448321 RepID=A0A317UXF9_9EURO|nr:zinc-containing alcohol dehydrogenase [Aspergillus heteromorphus CBS 117.55]PWY66723.1 zinc-containing alcohol dehydrogenase [Aspergillus heteromorphus CBS 117.55]